MTPLDSGERAGLVLDLFAGCGGWSEGLRSLGLSDIGLEWDRDCCLTRRAAGHRTIRADVAAYPPEPFAGRVSGLIASPPCQAWSMAGKGDGRRDVGRIHAAVELCRAGWTDAALAGPWADPRTPLILEPLRWAWTIRPRWVACEQVPPALPVWEHVADVLRSWGYDARAVRLLASDYGVPQTRLRAFLLASLDGPVRVPEPTHARMPEADLFGAARLPWVSMASALGWGYAGEPCTTVVGTGEGRTDPITGGAGAREKRIRAQEDGHWVIRTGTNSMKHSRNLADMVPYERGIDQPAPTVDAKAGGAWKLVGNNSVAGVGRAERAEDEPAMTVGSRADLWRLRSDAQRNATEPAPTIKGGHSFGEMEWVFDRPAPTITGTRRSEDGMLAGRQLPPGEGRNVGGKDWVNGRPATTVQGDPRIAPPGHKGDYLPGQRPFTDAVRITLAEAAVLQGMRPDYPFQGTKTSRFRQCGDLVPPAVARAVVAALRGAP